MRTDDQAALDCTDDTPEEWWATLRPYWRAYQRRAYRGYDCRVHTPPVAKSSPEDGAAWDALVLAHSEALTSRPLAVPTPDTNGRT